MYRFTILVLSIIALAATANGRYDEIKVDFTAELDVESLNAKSYTDFIRTLRQLSAASYSHGVPVLHVRDKYDPRGFDVKLTSGSHVTTVRIDDLKVAGFQAQRPQRWFEFGRPEKQPKQMIQGSELLGFDNTYDDLAAVAEQGVLDTSFNKKSLSGAVRNLAVSTNPKDRAKSLIVVNQIICEAIRFVDVANHFASNIDRMEPVRLPEWMLNDLENNWERFSYMVLKSDADPCYQFDPPTIHGKQIQTVDELRKILGIMKRDPDTLKPPCSPDTLYGKIKKILAYEARNLI